MTIWARGAGRGAGCGARGPRGCSEHSAVGAHGTGAFWAGVRGSCVPQVCVRLRGIRVPGLDAPGRALRTSRGRSCILPCTWRKCTSVALCPACYPERGYRLRLHPAPLLITGGPFPCSPPVPSGFGVGCVILRKSSGVYGASVRPRFSRQVSVDSMCVSC